MMITFACGHRGRVTLKSAGARAKSAEALRLSLSACRSCCEAARDDAPGYSVDFAGREVYDGEAAAQAYDRAEAKRAAEAAEALEAEEFTADDYAREELSDAAVSDAYHGSSDRGTPWHLYKGFGGSL